MSGAFLKPPVCQQQKKLYRSSHRQCSVKKVFLEISQNSQENTCARASFLIKLQAEVCNFTKKETLAQVFSCEFYEISKSTFSTEHLWTTSYRVHWQVKTCIGQSECHTFKKNSILLITTFLHWKNSVFDGWGVTSLRKSDWKSKV